MKFNKVLSIVLAILTHCSYPCGAANGRRKLEREVGMGRARKGADNLYGRNGKRPKFNSLQKVNESGMNVRNLGLGLLCVGVPAIGIGGGLMLANRKDRGAIPVSSVDATILTGEEISSGVQGTVYSCIFNDDNNYVLKKIDFHKIGHNPVVSEMLAYDKLKDLQCEHIVKPVYYVREAEKKAKFIYRFANGEKIGDSGLQKKIENLYGLPRKKLLVSIVDQLLGVVDLLHNKYGIAHGDMNHDNFLIHINEKNEASVRVIDFGYCYKLKDKYAKSDVEEMCHPVTSVIHFVKGIYVVVRSLIGKDEASKFCDCVLSEISGDLRGLVEDIVIRLNWPKFDWRMKHINEILKVDTKECDTVIVNVRKYINGIRLSLG